MSEHQGTPDKQRGDLFDDPFVRDSFLLNRWKAGVRVWTLTNTQA